MTNKESLREVVKQLSSLQYNGERTSKWVKIIQTKLSGSPDFNGKEDILNELNNYIHFVEINLQDDMNDLFSEVFENWWSQLGKNEIENENKIFEFENLIKEGDSIVDVKNLSSTYNGKSQEIDKFVNDFIKSYRKIENEKTSKFFSLYDSNPDECREILEMEIYYYSSFNHDAMSVDSEMVMIEE